MKTIRSDEALLFIDTMVYLDLYRTVNGKKALSPLLSEQAKHIFVTEQVVNEVQRNKIEAASDFLKKHFGILKLETFPLPNHLFGTSEDQNVKSLS
jgi:hypothetical protein